jgi:hypothetical protein
MTMRKLFSFLVKYSIIFILACWSIGLAYGGVGLGPGRLVVIFKKGITVQEATKVMIDHGVKVESKDSDRHWRKRPHMIINIPPGEEKEWIERLKLDENIKDVSQSYDFIITRSGKKDYFG